jgi:DNA-binding response OmpR family regulator
MAASVVILLVEDEPDVRDLVELALEEGGFSVVTTNRGEEAVTMLEADGAAYHALISDVNLGRGKLTGWDVAKRARELNNCRSSI